MIIQICQNQKDFFKVHGRNKSMNQCIENRKRLRNTLKFTHYLNQETDRLK